MAYVKKNWQNTPSTNTPINADNLNHMEQGIYDAAETADYAKDKVDDLQGLVYSPLVAATAAAMTDTTKVYVYTGSEAGYTSGHWYYYNGTAWADGGVYNSTAFNTDATLSHQGEAADAKATGDAIGDLNNALTTTDTFLSHLKQHTRNLWPLINDEEFTASLKVDMALLVGTYTVSFSSVTTTATENNVRMEFFDSNDTQLNIIDESVTTPTERSYLPIQKAQAKRIFTLNNACAYVKIYASDTAAHSTGKVATWKDVQVEKGRTLTPHVFPYTAYDAKAFNTSFADKVVVNFGDSIFGNYTAPNDISSVIAELTKATVYNVGFGGTRMTDNSAYGDKGWFSMCKLAEAVASGDFSGQETALQNIEDTDGLYRANLTKLEGLNFSKVDFVTMEQATNDWYGNTKLTQEGSSSNLVYDVALKYVIDTLQTAFPNLTIVLITPIYRWFSASSDSNNYTNTQGNTLIDFCNKIKQIATEFNLFCIDDYNIGINKYNHAMYLADGTHPTDAGIKLIGANIAKKLF